MKEGEQIQQLKNADTKKKPEADVPEEKQKAKAKPKAKAKLKSEASEPNTRPRRAAVPAEVSTGSVATVTAHESWAATRLNDW